ncbi:MAG: hypothetical protein IMZ55_10285 [Acidobacteria bacterium]|nr:hypothetical protein [Acidobacteriota bacterium]
MSDADTKHPRSTRVLAWSFAIGAVTLLAGIIVGFVAVVVGIIREGSHE